MKFFMKMVLILPLLFTGMACTGANEVEGVAVPFLKGTVDQEDAAGVEIEFFFDYPRAGLGDINFTNLSSKPIKLKITNKTTGEEILKDFLLTFPGNSDGIKDPAVFDQDDTVKIEIWIGYTAIYYSRYGWPATFRGEADLQEGNIHVSGVSDELVWNIALSEVKGVQCELAGERPPSDPLDQTNNTFFCKNDSSDTVRIELMVVTDVGGGNYDISLEAASFWIFAQLLEKADIATVSRVISPSELLAVRVSAYDPLDLDNWISQGNIVFTADVATESFTTVAVNATLIE